MTKFDFLAELRAQLVGRIPADELEGHISFYENYINSQVRMGMSEESVVNGLNKPALLAKSILAAADAKMEETDDNSDVNGASTGSTQLRRILSFGNWPTWAKIAGISITAIIILTIFVKLIIFALPVLLPIGLVIFLYNYFERKKR